VQLFKKKNNQKAKKDFSAEKGSGFWWTASVKSRPTGKPLPGEWCNVQNECGANFKKKRARKTTEVKNRVGPPCEQLGVVGPKIEKTTP